MDINDISFIHEEYCEYYKGYSIIGSYDIFIPFYRVVMKMNYVAETCVNLLEEFICKCISREIVKKKDICEVLSIDDYILKFTLEELKNKKYLIENNEEFNFTEEGEKLFRRRIKLIENSKNIPWYYNGVYPEFNGDFFNKDSSHILKKFKDIEKMENAFFINPITFPKYDREKDFMNISHEVIKYHNKNLQEEEEKIVNINYFEMINDRDLFYHKYILMMFKNKEGRYKLLAYDPCGSYGVETKVTENLQKLYEEGKLLNLISCENKEKVQELLDAMNGIDNKYHLEYIEELRDRFNNEKSEGNLMPFDEYKEDYLMNYEIREKFLYFLKNAKESLYIISPWMNNYIINDDFIEDIKNLLEEGVRIRIKYGISHTKDIEENYRNKNTHNIAKKLKDIGKPYGDLLKIEHGQTHEKLCICDKKYYINGSFNFLSYSGEQNSAGFRNEGSTYSENKRLIETVIRKRFNE